MQTQLRPVLQGKRVSTFGLVLALSAAGLSVAAVGSGCSRSDDAIAVEPIAPPPVTTPAPAPPTPEPEPTPAPTPAPFVLTELPVPTLESILPTPQTTADLRQVHTTGLQLLGQPDVAAVATPLAELTPGYAEPTYADPPLLALNYETLWFPAAWLVVEATDDGAWLRVLVPLGRGALPSENPDAVNQRAVWIQASEVELQPIRASIVVDVAQRTVTVTDDDGEVREAPVGVGRIDRSDTPTGITAIVGYHISTGNKPIAIATLQSATLDRFGADFALWAIHRDPAGGRTVGQAESNGCLRMHEADFQELIYRRLPLGTPIWIH